MLFIHNDVQKQNLTMAECIAVQDDAFTKIPAGGAGLGVKYLAREDAHVVGMLGSGEMARTHLEAYLEVRDIQQVKVFSPTPANRESYAADMAERFGIEMVPVGSAREAIRGVDILSPCTDSMQPVYDADWLEPGMHVVALQTQETSHEAAARFDVKIRQGIDCMHLSAEQESLRVRRTSGLSWTAFVGGSEEEMTRIPEDSPHRLPVEDYAHFSDLANGTVPGRVDRDQITFYYNNGTVPGRVDRDQITFYYGNQGIQFASVGGRIYRNVVRNGGAREMPTEWFLEDMRA